MESLAMSSAPLVAPAPVLTSSMTISDVFKLTDDFMKKLAKCREAFAASSVLGICGPKYRPPLLTYFDSDANEFGSQLENLKNQVQDFKKGQEPIIFDFTQYLIWKAFLTRVRANPNSRLTVELVSVNSLLTIITKLIPIFRFANIPQVNFTELIGYNLAEDEIYKERIICAEKDIELSHFFIKSQTKSLCGYMAYSKKTLDTLKKKSEGAFLKCLDELFYYLGFIAREDVMGRYLKKKSEFEQKGKGIIEMERVKEEQAANVVQRRGSEEDELASIQHLQSITLPLALRNHQFSSSDGEEAVKLERDLLERMEKYEVGPKRGYLSEEYHSAETSRLDDDEVEERLEEAFKELNDVAPTETNGEASGMPTTSSKQ